MAQTLNAEIEKKPRVLKIGYDQPTLRPASRISRLAQHSRRIPGWALAMLAAIAVAAVVAWLLYAHHFESTDDAQIEGHLNAISARVSGTVVYINPNAEKNQYVEAGTLLVQLDP